MCGSSGIEKHRVLGGEIFGWLKKNLNILKDTLVNYITQGNKTHKEIVEAHKHDDKPDSFHKAMGMKDALKQLKKPENPTIDENKSFKISHN